jgi:hypothetical protein
MVYPRLRCKAILAPTRRQVNAAALLREVHAAEEGVGVGVERLPPRWDTEEPQAEPKAQAVAFLDLLTFSFALNPNSYGAGGRERRYS